MPAQACGHFAPAMGIPMKLALVTMVAYWHEILSSF